MEYKIYRILVIHVIQTYRETAYKIEKAFFHFLTEKIIFVPIYKFCQKTFGDIAPPLCNTHFIEYFPLKN
jgi:hypothetical protein